MPSGSLHWRLAPLERPDGSSRIENSDPFPDLDEAGDSLGGKEHGSDPEDDLEAARPEIEFDGNPSKHEKPRTKQPRIRCREGIADEGKSDDGDRLLPEVAVGDVISLDKLRPEQHFTEPPPRFTEASLVKTLEEYGIGRPSTYASIIATLKNEYNPSRLDELKT